MAESENSGQYSTYVKRADVTIKFREFVAGRYSNDNNRSDESALDRKTLKFLDGSRVTCDNAVYVLFDSLREVNEYTFMESGELGKKCLVVRNVSGKKVIAINRKTFDRYISNTTMKSLDDVYQNAQRVIEQKYGKYKLMSMIKSEVIDTYRREVCKEFMYFDPTLFPECMRELLYSLKRQDNKFLSMIEQADRMLPTKGIKFNFKGLNEKVGKIKKRYPLANAMFELKAYNKMNKTEQAHLQQYFASVA